MDTRAFYLAALLGLRFVEARSPTTRRFGPDAKARWDHFKGHLQTSDRIDLLLRDAEVAYPGAFSARQVFGLSAVAEDDPFGLDWPSVDDNQIAIRIFAEAEAFAVPPTVSDTLLACAKVWDLKVSPVDIGPLSPSARVLVTGPSAMIALAGAFSRNPGLAWADQVTCVASEPAARQLAALCSALLNCSKPTRLVSAASSAEAPKAGLFDRCFESPDASPADIELTRKLFPKA